MEDAGAPSRRLVLPSSSLAKGPKGRSPSTTPTKNGGDRFIPVRLPAAESQLRFQALQPVQSPRKRLHLASGRPVALPSGSPADNAANVAAGGGGGAGGAGGAPPTSSAQELEAQNEQRAHRALLRNELLNAGIEDVRSEPGVSGLGPRQSPNSRKVSASAALASPLDQNSSPPLSLAGTSLFKFSRPNKSPAKRTLTFRDPADTVSQTLKANVALSSIALPQSSGSDENAGGSGGGSLPASASLAPLRASSLSVSLAASEPLSSLMMERSRLHLSPYTLTPLSEQSQRLLRATRKPTRKIPRNPYKVLDAPELQDDFYLNLIDWSSSNVLAVGLGSCVYLWNAWNSNVQKLCDLSEEEDSVTSVEWNAKGDVIAVGTQRGNVGLWPLAVPGTRLSNLPGHTSRVGCLAWNGELVCSGSRDRFILQRDVRAPRTGGAGPAERKLAAHKQEVCGLRWSPDSQHLASGGNDNQLLIWNLGSPAPVQTHTEHTAAVKALAWSPHHHGLLVSGGGTADRTLRFWNTLTGQPMQSHDTGSQVCNIAWSRHSNELVSTHGYSQNQIVVWKYPGLQQVCRLTGHTFRVLYLAMSPEGDAIVTGAGDETLRFWQVFSKHPAFRDSRSKLSLATAIR